MGRFRKKRGITPMDMTPFIDIVSPNLPREGYNFISLFIFIFVRLI